jgi:hypothetical protein
LRPPPDTLDRIPLRRQVVDLFGVELTAIGVPFTQPDVHYGPGCAQVAAWIAHRSAALRGIVAWKPFAEFGGDRESSANSNPLAGDWGIGLEELKTLVGRTDLAGLLIANADIPTLGHARPAQQVLATIDRYVGSGFPVILLCDGHATVVVGTSPAADPDPYLIVHDSDAGPYQKMTLAQVVRDDQALLLVPLPRSVSLTGEAAEMRAALMMRLSIARSPRALRDETDPFLVSRLIRASEYKRQLGTRQLSTEAEAPLRLARLPSWCWVVQASLPDDPLRIVLETLFDAASPVSDPQLAAFLAPGVVGFPGESAPQDLHAVESGGAWLPLGLTPGA